MPEPHQTPASRRFLQPSSSARSQTTSSSIRRTQFARPSQVASSSPFSRTPFLKARNQDDIETSFEESTYSPPLTAQSKPKPRKGDLIEDDDQIETTTVSAHRHLLPDVQSDSHNIYDEFEEDPTDDFARADFSSPLPKRQKITHSTTRTKDTIDISSSSSSGSDGGLLDDDQLIIVPKPSNTIANDIDSYSDDEELEKNLTAKSKFRLRSDIHDSQISADKAVARNAFRGISSGKPWLESPLPATFSPSKRKGKQDYIYGGAAETVRGWILDVANEQSSTDGSGRSIEVSTTLIDVSGRFELVEDNESTWILVHQNHQTVPRNSSNIRDTNPRTIGLRGAGTSWDLDLPETPFAERSTLRVAVLWNEQKQ